MDSKSDSDVHNPAARVRALSDYGLRMTEVESGIPAGLYFKSGKEMIRMADVYEEEGELEKAFILYNKFTTLFVEKLPKHPGYKGVSSEEKSKNKVFLTNRVFPKAMQIKSKLVEKYTAEENIRQAELRRIREEEEKRLEQQRLADEKRRKEEARRREEQQAKMLLETEDQFRRMQMQEKSKLDENRSNSGRVILNNVSTVTVNDASQFDSRTQSTVLSDRVTSRTSVSSSVIGPPPPSSLSGIVPSAPSDLSPVLPSPPPAVPPPSYTSVVYVDQRPEIPSRSLKPGDQGTSPVTPPSIDRSSKPAGIDHFTSVGETGLKPVHVPGDLVTSFLHRALANTARSVETCGILCGKLKSGHWHVTHMLIPQQSGTPDSCDIMNEEVIVDYQDKHNLVTLGWIHTHPTQTAFLSSVDQHTHWPYQKLLPEAVAIVCSPKFNEVGYFYLTPDYGMEFVGRCKGKGFHEHPSHQPLFEKCPHVLIDQQAMVTVTDLRMHGSR